MGVFHWSPPVDNYMYFLRVGSRLGSVVVSPASRNGLAKYQTCLIFHRPSTTLHPNCGSAHLEIILLWISTACRLHFPSCHTLLLTCVQNFPSCPGYNYQDYQDSTSRQADNINPLYLKGSRPVVNITNLTYTLSCYDSISAGQTGYTTDKPGTV